MIQNMLNTKNNFSKERKEEISQKKFQIQEKNILKNMSDEEHKLYSECRKETWANKSEEEMKRLSDLQKEIYNNKSEEEKEFIKEQNRIFMNRLCTEEYCKNRYENIKKSNLEKYGVENPFQRQDVVDKIKDTKLEKYSSLSLGVRVYKYNDIKFDSSTELYYYIYHHDILKDDITRGKHFKYYIDGVQHIYECDFLVNNENIEIKGNHMINENMKLINIYGDKHINKEKTQCMRDNNIQIISKILYLKCFKIDNT